MLSMCGLLCSVLRGWRHNQAVMLMARVLSQANSSLLVQDVAPGSGTGPGRGDVSSFCVADGEKELTQLLWCDNNKQAIIVSPRQCVDLQRWTLFLSSTTPNPMTVPHCPGSNGTTSTAEEDGEGVTVTVLLEATYRERDDEVHPEYHVMVEQLSQPYAWKARDVFGVIVTTTPPQLLAMIQAFFNNALHIDDDFLIKKIITIEVVGEPASLADPLSIPECVTPGPWSANQSALTQMELARSLSPSGVQGPGGGASRTPGNSLRPPALWGLLRHQSSGESSTSTTLHPQSSTDSERHHSSLDPQSSYDSVSDYPTSDTDDLTCNVTGLYPRGWAVSGGHVVSGQPLSVRAALSQLHQPGQSCSIVTNPLEDLWQEEESRRGRAADDGCVGHQSVACLNGPSTASCQVRSKTLPRVKKGCGHPHSCLPGSVICQRVQPPQPGRKEQEMVREAAQYYQRALDAAHTRYEGFARDHSSASDEDFSFSGSHEEGVVTKEPIKYPVCIRSEADLTRATSIIRDNLANIIQNYLFKPGTSSESQPLVSHLALDHPTIKLVETSGGEVESHLSTSGSSESKEGSSPPPLVMAGGGQVQVPPIAPIHKAPVLMNKASAQHHSLPKAKSSSLSSTAQVTSFPGAYQKPESSFELLPCVARKERQPVASTSKSTGKPSVRGDKRLTKSEEIVLPPFIRESNIDVPISADDVLTTTSSIILAPEHTLCHPHQQHSITTSPEKKEMNKCDIATERLAEGDMKRVTASPEELERVGLPSTQTPAPDISMITKIHENALVSAPDAPIVHKIQETAMPSDIQETFMVSSTGTGMVPERQISAMVSSSGSSQDTGISSSTPPAIALTVLDASQSPVETLASCTKIDIIPDIAMIPPTPDTDTDSGPGTVMASATPDTDTDSTPGTVMTSVSPDTDLTPTSPDKDIMQALPAMDATTVNQELTKDLTSLDRDIMPTTPDVKVTPVDPLITLSSNLIRTPEDMTQGAVDTNLTSKVSSLDMDRVIDTTTMATTSPDIGTNGEKCVTVGSPVGKYETGVCDVYSPEAVVTIVHDGCISPIMENNMSWEGSSPTNGVSEESTQRSRCLKDTHKLNTKSSTASESSFESLPYRMLTSQPESLTDDVAAAITIELTRPPLENERLRAARLELIRQERIHAISLMSTVTTDSEEGHVWAASLEEQPGGSPIVENVSQETWESPVLDSGVELAMQESCIESSSKPQPCSPTSPTESAPESGFSSLRETAVEGSGRGARNGVCLSKSKDSLDLTDADRCPGTDTFSDDMETLSSSAGEATLMESGPVSQRASPRNSVSDSTHHDSGLGVPSQEVSQFEGKVLRGLDSTSGVITEEKASRYLSDDSSEYIMKTSESLSSEDTVISRPSLDDHVPKRESQGSHKDSVEPHEAGTRLSPQSCLRAGKHEQETKEAINGYGAFEDKWEPHYTWPPGLNFMSQALHVSIADKLRLLSESEAEANIRVHVRGHRSKRALSAAAGSTSGHPSNRAEPHLKAEAQVASHNGSHTHTNKISVTDAKPHNRRKSEQLTPTTSKTQNSAPVSDYSMTVETINNVPVTGQPTIAKIQSSVPDPDPSIYISKAQVQTVTSEDQCTTFPYSQSTDKIQSSTPVPDHSITVKRDSSAHVPYQSTTVKTYTGAHVVDQSICAKSHSSRSVPVQSATMKIHSSSPVHSQSTTAQVCSSVPVPVQSIPATIPSIHVPSQATTVQTSSTTLTPDQLTITEREGTVPVSGETATMKTGSSASVSQQTPASKTYSSGTSLTASTLSKTDSSGPVPDKTTITSSSTSATISSTDAYSSTTTNSSKPSRHSSKSGISDLEDEVFLPPPENYILNGHPVIYCPRVDMTSQTRASFPKTAMSLYGVSVVCQEGAHHSSSPHSNTCLPAQHCTPLTPPASAQTSKSPSSAVLSTSLSSTVPSRTAGPSSLFSLPPEGETVQLGGMAPAVVATARTIITRVQGDDQWSSTGLKQQQNLQQNYVDSAADLHKDACPANHLPPTPESGRLALIHHHQTTATTTITTTSSITSTIISSVIETPKSTVMKRGRLGKPSTAVHSSKEKFQELRSGETTPRSAGELVEGGDGKPRLQHMAHLERTDTSGSPTSTRTPTPPVNPQIPGSKCEATTIALMTSASQNLGKKNGKFEVISKNDIAPRLASAEDLEQDLREEGSKEKWSRGPREARRGGSEEAPARPYVPNLRKYGSEDLSRATPDSYASSTSKSYLDPDLGSVVSFQVTGGSLELLEGSQRGHRPSLTCTSMTAAQSQELARCEQVSLKSQGSLDKFPHFDQVSANQRQVVPRRKGTSVDDPGTARSEHMHRSFTLPGSLSSPRKDDKKKEKEEKGKKKKKEKEGMGGGEKKSAMMSLKGLLRRNKSKEKEKEGIQERVSSPSLFRRLERRSKSGSPSPLSDSSTRQPHPGNSPPGSPVDSASHSPIVANGKTRPVISSPVALQQPAPLTTAPVTTIITTTTVAPSRSAAITCSDSESAPSSTPASPQRRVSLARGGGLAGQPSPRLYKHVLTRNLSSSQESLDSSILSSAQSSSQSSPHGSPQHYVIPQSASSLSLPTGRELSPPAPVMGTRALRGSSNSFSVTIGFRPRVERRRGQRTVSEGANLNCVSLSPGPRRGEGSRVLTQLGKRSSSMEILVCGKIREHCPEQGSSSGGSRVPFSREGSFRLHREISVETLFEVPEGGGVGGSQEDYRRYLDRVHAARHGSSSSLAEEPCPPKEPLPHHRIRKYSVPQGMHLSGMREATMSNPNLQRCSSPLVRGMTHSSTFSSSPLRRPPSATPAFSPAKRNLVSSAGGSQAGEMGGSPLMRVEEEGPTRRNLDSATDKPPNILVYAANNVEYYDKVQQTLTCCLNPDRYIIYHLTDELAFKSPWSGSTTLLVVCGDVPAHISTVFIRYLLKGGRVLSVCSDFLNMAVPLFGTVEVQEQAVVSVSYQQWSSVHLLHHQHCFHSSPRNKRFSRNTEAALKDPANRSAVSVEPTHVEIIDEYGGRHRLDLRVLATDDTWGAPTLLSAKVHGGQGTAVFSQVHLEHDPQTSLPASSEATSQLAGSNTARLEILRELLTSELSLDTSSHPSVAYTPAYFLGRHQMKEELLSQLQPHMVGEELQRSHLTIQFVMPGSIPKQPAENLLPILTSACPLTFSTVKYFEALTTSSIGRLVIYCEVMSSSMRVMAGSPPLVHGLVVIPTQQTHGQGRSGNVWLSPLGCAMFSVQLHLALSSPLGQHLSFMQHLAAIAIVQAVVTLPGYADIPLFLKWPNDIYLGSDLKIGGVVVEATTLGPQVIANVGCGVNLSNSNPTGCLNDAIRQYNQEHNADLAELEREVFLARVFNTLESLIHIFQTRGPGAVQHLYYRHWLHSNAVVTVQSEHRHTQSAVVVGIDTYGFLQARLASGETITLQPDGNSFNMMEGLVYSKVK